MGYNEYKEGHTRYVDELSYAQKTALILIAQYHKQNQPKTAMAKLLLDRGADLTVQNKHGATALFYAAKFGGADIVHLFIEHWKKLGLAGQALDKPDYQQKTALNMATGYNCVVDACDYHAQIAAMLSGVNFPCITQTDLENHAQNEKLLKAAKNNNAKEVEEALNSGADVNVRDEEGRSALVIAAQKQKGSQDVAKIVLDRGANCDCADNNGHIALTYAAIKNAVKVTELILEADKKRIIEMRDGLPVAATKKGHLAMLEAARHDSVEVLQLLLNIGVPIKGITPNPLVYGSRFGSEKVVEKLLQHAEGKIIDNDKALQKASEFNHSNIAKLLLADHSKHHPLQVSDSTNELADNSEALKIAIKHDNMDVADLLVRNGADINKRFEHQRSLLMMASRKEFKKDDKDSVETTKWLLLHGADTETKNKLDQTAIAYAALRDTPATAKVLIAAGANLTNRDKLQEGETDLFASHKEKNPTMYFLLHTEQQRQQKMSADRLKAFLKGKREDTLKRWRAGPKRHTDPLPSHGFRASSNPGPPPVGLSRSVSDSGVVGIDVNRVPSWLGGPLDSQFGPAAQHPGAQQGPGAQPSQEPTATTETGDQNGSQNQTGDDPNSNSQQQPGGGKGGGGGGSRGGGKGKSGGGKKSIRKTTTSTSGNGNKNTENGNKTNPSAQNKNAPKKKDMQKQVATVKSNLESSSTDLQAADTYAAIVKILTEVLVHSAQFESLCAAPKNVHASQPLPQPVMASFIQLQDTPSSPLSDADRESISGAYEKMGTALQEALARADGTKTDELVQEVEVLTRQIDQKFQAIASSDGKMSILQDAVTKGTNASLPIWAWFLIIAGAIVVVGFLVGVPAIHFRNAHRQAIARKEFANASGREFNASAIKASFSNSRYNTYQSLPTTNSMDEDEEEHDIEEGRPTTKIKIIDIEDAEITESDPKKAFRRAKTLPGLDDPNFFSQPAVADRDAPDFFEKQRLALQESREYQNWLAENPQPKEDFSEKVYIPPDVTGRIPDYVKGTAMPGNEPRRKNLKTMNTLESIKEEGNNGPKETPEAEEKLAKEKADKQSGVTPRPQITQPPATGSNEPPVPAQQPYGYGFDEPVVKEGDPKPVYVPPGTKHHDVVVDAVIVQSAFFDII